MKRALLLSSAAICALVSLALVGCGGRSAIGQSRGSAGIRIFWPPRTRVIPSNANSVVINAYSSADPAFTTPLGTSPQVATRPGTISGSGWGSVQIDGLPQTSSQTHIVLVAKAYVAESPAPADIPLASATITGISITPGNVTPENNITLDSTIAVVKAVINGGSPITLPNGSGGAVSLPIGSTATVQFEAFDGTGPSPNRVLMPTGDLTITTTGNVLAENSNSVPGTDAVTIVAANDHRATNTVALADFVQPDIFVHNKKGVGTVLTVTFVDPALSLHTAGGSYTVSDANILVDIAAGYTNGISTNVNGLFEQALSSSSDVPPVPSYGGIANFAQNPVSYGDPLLYTWPTLWSAPSPGCRLAAGGASITAFFAGLQDTGFGSSDIVNLANGHTAGASLNGAWGSLSDLDARPGSDLFALFESSGVMTVAELADGGSGLNLQASFHPSGISGANGNLAVTSLPVSPAQSLAVLYVSSGSQVERFIAGAKDTDFRPASLNQIVDMSADGPLLYILDSSGGTLTVRVLSWDGSELSASHLALSGLNTFPGHSLKASRIVARGGAVYVEYNDFNATNGLVGYGTAVIQ